MMLLTRLIVKLTQPYYVRQQKELGNLNGYIEERVSGQKVVLLFGQEELVKEEFSVINNRLMKSAVYSQALSGIMGPLNNFVNNFSYLLIAVCGAYFLLRGMNLTVGGIFAFILYMRSFTRPINEILNTFNTIQSALAGAERVFEVIDEPKERDSDNAKDTLSIDGSVVLKIVHFSYTKDREIVKSVSLTGNKGQTIAIVGPTGSGKTPLINLQSRFYFSSVKYIFTFCSFTFDVL
jgi:ATP-binding cassette subfamily B protein